MITARSRGLGSIKYRVTELVLCANAVSPSAYRQGYGNDTPLQLKVANHWTERGSVLLADTADYRWDNHFPEFYQSACELPASLSLQRHVRTGSVESSSRFRCPLQE